MASGYPNGGQFPGYPGGLDRNAYTSHPQQGPVPGAMVPHGPRSTGSRPLPTPQGQYENRYAWSGGSRPLPPQPVVEPTPYGQGAPAALVPGGRHSADSGEFHDTNEMIDDGERRKSATDFADESGFPNQGYLPPQEMDDEKYSGPTEAFMPGHIRSGHGIWSYDDLHAFQQRSLLNKIFRILVFILTWGIIIALTVILLIFLFLRPPNLGLKGVDVPTSADAIHYDEGTFSFDVPIHAVIANPNRVPIKIDKFSTYMFDSQDQRTSIGNCTHPNFQLPPEKNTTIDLPCGVNYDVNKDKDHSIIRDLAQKCGITKGSKKGNIDLLLQVRLTIRFIGFYIPLSFSPTISFECPLDKERVEKEFGKDIPDIIGKLGRRSLEAPAWSSEMLDRAKRGAAQVVHDTHRWMKRVGTLDGAESLHDAL